jgi:chromosomal replication initiator protein
MSTQDPQILWETLRGGLAERLSESSFRDWIEPCRPLSCDGATLWIQVPSPSARIWIEQQLAEEFNDALVQADQANLRLVFSVAEEDPSPKPARKAPISKQARPGEAQDQFPQLFHRYTLDRFVVGPGSQLAFAAARAVVDDYGKANAGFNMNPLFVYGGAGLGKTHLMIGIGKALKARHPELAVCYLKVDQFFHELTGAIKNRNTEPLRRKYQQNDVSCWTTQTLRSMERTQEEIFYILGTSSRTEADRHHPDNRRRSWRAPRAPDHALQVGSDRQSSPRISRPASPS